MMESVYKILDLLDAGERRRLVALQAIFIITGLVQIAGVGSILPFISLLSDKGLVHTNQTANWVYETFEFASVNAFLIYAGLFVTTLLIAGNALVALSIWLIARFAWSNQLRLSTRLLAGYLGQPYEAFLNRNSADIGKNILMESQNFANSVLIPAMNLVAFGIIVAFLAGLLLVLDPRLAVLVALVFGSAYLAVYLLVRRRLALVGERRMVANTERFKSVSEAFGSVKEVKVLGREAHFVQQYSPAARTFAEAMVVQNVFSNAPRYGIEALVFGFVMVTFIYLLSTEGAVQGMLPVAGAFALAGYRMMPALQQIYYSVTAFRFNQPVLDVIHHDVMQHASTNSAAGARPVPMTFTRELRLDGLSYTYPGAEEPTLKSVSLAIPRDAFVAFVGHTGSGKTTLADVILGLLAPQEGTFSVDGVPVTEANRRAWQANIGYVPQDIYLTDDTVAANIAYGVPAEMRDPAAVERAARIAKIHDFIVTQLPQGYDTAVGERGVRISGGQRQRIGIARALYHDPQVLVLDEATSALDNETESRLVDELAAMRGKRTVIVIAHRLSTVRRSERVFLLESGQVLGVGSYDELVASSLEFRRLIVAQATGDEASPSLTGAE